jgi:hypothetical protein
MINHKIHRHCDVVKTTTTKYLRPLPDDSYYLILFIGRNLFNIIIVIDKKEEQNFVIKLIKKVVAKVSWD